jgi:hypothetical protein
MIFGRSKPTVFKPVSYQRQRKPFRIPKWLLLLLLGIAMGAGGLWHIQETYLPPRLSPEEGNKLRADLEQANKDRAQLRIDLKQSNDKLALTETESKKAQADLATAKITSDKLQKDLSQFVMALPPDPRGGPIGIRAASFAPAGGQLNYNVIFTRNRKGDDVFRGVMQLLVTGTRAGKPETVSLTPVTMGLEGYQQLSGSLPMPDGLIAREVSIRVLRSAGGELMSMRVYKLI